MVCVHTPVNVSQIIENIMKNENNIRELILIEKELLLHEVADTRGLPIKFVKLSDEERRGLIRGLRWVLDDDEDLS